MICIQCQAEIPDDSQFCLHCGAAQGEPPGDERLQLLENAEQCYTAKQLASCRACLQALNESLALSPAAADGPFATLSPEMKRFDALETRLHKQEERLTELQQATAQALAERDYKRCCELAEKAAKLTAEASGCEAVWAEAQAAQEQLREALVAAREAQQRQEWTTVRRHCQELLRLRPGHTEARHLLDTADQALGRHRRLLGALTVAGILLILGLAGVGMLMVRSRRAAARERQFQTALAEGQELLKAQRWDAARDALNQALAVPGYAGDAVAAEGLKEVEVGRLLAAAAGAADGGDWMKAREQAEAALAILPASGEALACLEQATGRLLMDRIRVEVDRHEYAAAERLLKQIPAGFRDPAVIPLAKAVTDGRAMRDLLTRAQDLLNQQQWQAAAELARQAAALKIDPPACEKVLHQAEAGTALVAARAAAARQDWPVAQEELRHAQELDPDSMALRDFRMEFAAEIAKVLRGRAQDAFAQRHFAEARKLTEQLLQVLPDDDKAIALRDDSQRELAKYEAELAAGDQAREARQLEQAAAHYARARELFPDGEATDRLQALKSAAGNVEALFEKAENAFAQNDFGTAMALSQEILKRDTRNEGALRLRRRVQEIAARSQALYDQAQAALKRGDPALALLHLKQLLTSDPNHAEARALLKSMRNDRHAADRLLTKAREALAAAPKAEPGDRQDLYEQSFTAALQALQLLNEDGEAERLVRATMAYLSPDGFIAITTPELTIGVDNEFQTRLARLLDSPADEPWDKDETPAFRARLRPFWISRHEVTNQEFCEFLNARNSPDGEAARRRFLSADFKQFNIRFREGRFVPAGVEAAKPVVGITWTDAQAYCRWFGRGLDLPGNLPTEAQWEMAAASDGVGKPKRVFPWGDDVAKARTVGRESIIRTQVETTPIDTSADGVKDLAGNVAEWCRDWYREDYYRECRKLALTRDPSGPADGMFRVVRGGCATAAGMALPALRTTNRDHLAPSEARSNVGFRVVLELPVME